MIGFVLLNYVVYDQTINCIASIKKLEGEKHIVVIDNYSPNESFDKLFNLYKEDNEITIIKNNINDGFARGNNLGYKYLRIHYNCDFIVVMNNDMEIKQFDFIKKIYEIYHCNRFDILGPDIYSVRDDRHQNPENVRNYSYKELLIVRRKLILKKILSFLFYLKALKNKFLKPKIKKKNDSNYKEEKYNVVLHGSCYIFSKQFIQNEINCFYDKTFMYFESYILHYLAQKKNYKILYSPILQVYHFEDATTDKIYNTSYKKAIFGNKCLLDSCNKFIELMKENMK